MAKGATLKDLAEEYKTDIATLVDILQARGMASATMLLVAPLDPAREKVIKDFFTGKKPAPVPATPVAVNKLRQLPAIKVTQPPGKSGGLEYHFVGGVPSDGSRSYIDINARNEIRAAVQSRADRLDLSGKPWSRLEEEIILLKDHLKHLVLGSFLDERDPDLSIIGKLSFLETLSLANVRLTSVSSIPDIPGLQSLVLNSPSLQSLRGIGRFSKLKRFGLRRELRPRLVRSDKEEHRIQDIQELGNLKMLETLDMPGQAIKDISVLASLKELRQVDLSDNMIVDISPLSALPRLEQLLLRKNNISSILPLKGFLKRNVTVQNFLYSADKNVKYRPADKFLNITENPLIDPPSFVLSEGVKNILDYWDNEDKNRNAPRQVLNEVKLIIVGNSNAGKSTLVHYLSNKHLPKEAPESTRGLDFGKWVPKFEVGGKKFSVNILDFGGQEYYHDIHHLFFNDRAAYLLLWDPETNYHKFQPSRGVPTRHFPIEYWLKAIEIHSQQDPDDPGTKNSFWAPVLLVQTYGDKWGRKLLNLADLQTKHPQLYDAVTISLDIKNRGVSGIEILESYLQAMFRQMRIGFGTHFQASWIKIKELIEEREQESRIMTVEEFRLYFLEHTGDERQAKEGLKFICLALDHWGSILYKPNIGKQGVVIINPQHFTRQLNAILGENLRAGNGLIDKSQISGLMKAPEKLDLFLQVLQSFRILFALPLAEGSKEQKYISPMYLKDRPAHLNVFLHNFSTFYRVRFEGYFHMGILLDCFSRLGHEIPMEGGNDFYWQWGVVLKRGDRIFSVEFDGNNLNTILIRTNKKEGLGDDPLLLDILGFIEEGKLYNHHVELSIDGVHYLSKKEVIEQLRNGVYLYLQGKKTFNLRSYIFLLKKEEVEMPNKRVFISYSSRDRGYLDQLNTHLNLYKRAGKIDYWCDLKLDDREEWSQQIKDQMEWSNILFVLLSSHSLTSEYIMQHAIPQALQYLKDPASGKRVIWVLLMPCAYELVEDISKYTIFPLKTKDPRTGEVTQKAISSNPDTHEEWTRLLKKVLEEDNF